MNNNKPSVSLSNRPTARKCDNNADADDDCGDGGSGVVVVVPLAAAVDWNNKS